MNYPLALARGIPARVIVEVYDESAETQQMFSKNTPNITVISESGLYRILAKCNLPKCEPFENWVFDEVLPSIRKPLVSDMKLVAFSLHGAVFDTPFNLCYKSRLSRGTRGQKD